MTYLIRYTLYIVTLIKKINFFVIGNTMYAGTQYLTIVLVTHYCRLDESVSYVYNLALVSPIFVFFNMNIRLYAVPEKEINVNALNIFQIYSLCVFIIVSCCITATYGLNSKMYLIPISIVILKVTEGRFDFLYALLQKQGDNSKVGRSQVIRSMITCLPFAFISVTSLQVILTCTSVVSTLYYIILNSMLKLYNTEWTSTLNSIKPILQNSWKLSFIALIDVVIIQVPKYLFVLYGFSEKAVIFNSLFLLTYPSGILLQVICLSYLNIEFTKRQLGKLLVLAVLLSSLTVLLMGLGGYSVTFLYGKSLNFDKLSVICALFLTFPINLGVVLSMYLYQRQKINEILYIGLLSLILYIVVYIICFENNINRIVDGFCVLFVLFSITSVLKFFRVIKDYGKKNSYQIS